MRERWDVAIHHAHHCRGDPPKRERVHQRQRPHLIEKQGDVRDYERHRGDANGEERNRDGEEMDRRASDPEQVGMIQMLVMMSGPGGFGSRCRRGARGFRLPCRFKSASHDAKTISSYPAGGRRAKSVARAKGRRNGFAMLAARRSCALLVEWTRVYPGPDGRDA